MLCMLLMFLAGDLRYDVTSYRPLATIETEDGALVSPNSALLIGDTLFMVNFNKMNIWRYQLSNNSFFSFSSLGEAPGSLQRNLVSWFPDGDNLIVLHANGSRQESFGMIDGDLKDSRRIQGQPVFYQKGSVTISKSRNDYVLRKGEKTLATALGFPIDRYGVQVHTAPLGNFFMIATTMSKNNTIQYVVFDLEKGLCVQSNGGIEKRQRITQENLPEHIKKDFNGMDIDTLFFNNFQVLLGVEGYGFVILEYGMNLFESETRGRYSVLHLIDPTTFNDQVVTVYHGRLKHLSMVIPRKTGAWIGFEPGEGKLHSLDLRLIK